ncbi:MAG: four helix bundle protein [Candidatus Margulisbacteria bacterium]|nr:four helix bundle protein [Candidatus Margulisiibacteriota bacterium]
MKKYNQTIQDRSYKYALMIIKLVEKLPKDNAANIIGKQLIRSATSIGANIAEAQSASSRRDFTNFYNHSLKSSNESKFWMKLLKDSEKANKEDIMPLINETNELANILAASILKLKGKV